MLFSTKNFIRKIFSFNRLWLYIKSMTLKCLLGALWYTPAFLCYARFFCHFVQNPLNQKEAVVPAYRVKFVSLRFTLFQWKGRSKENLFETRIQRENCKLAPGCQNYTLFKDEISKQFQRGKKDHKKICDFTFLFFPCSVIHIQLCL